MAHKSTEFNATIYKETTLQQWSTATEAWDRWGPLLHRWLGPATETMLDMCDIKDGSRVLDVAAGAGEQTMKVAKRIGNSGQVLATDISPIILEYASKAAKLAGYDNVQTLVRDRVIISNFEGPLSGNKNIKLMVKMINHMTILQRKKIQLWEV